MSSLETNQKHGAKRSLLVLAGSALALTLSACAIVPYPPGFHGPRAAIILPPPPPILVPPRIIVDPGWHQRGRHHRHHDHY